MAYKVLGDRIKKIRLENNMTQQEFAEALGYTHKSMINKIETGQTDISFDIVLKLMIIFKVNANEFLDLSDAESEELMIKADKADKPDWRKVHPLKSRDESVVYVKPTVIANPNIIVGEYTYFDGQNFQRHVTHHYDFIGDKLIIGKFCQIGRGVEFIMNGANHQMNSVSTYPFYIFNGWRQDPPKKEDLPYKGDTVIGNDVWIGQNVTFLPGVHVGDGCIVGANAVVGSDIPPYSVVVGNPARVIRRRFDDEMIELLEKLEWWNKTTNQIQKIIPLLSNSDIAYVKEELKCILNLVQSKNGHNKIIVVGPSGAGKSYFSKQLASITGLPLYHLDNIFWKENKTHISREEFDEKLLKILEQDKWIIDGDYSRTYELRIRYADTIYFLDFPLEVALEGVESRIGKPRDDIPWKEEVFDPDFKQWIIDWYKNTQPWVYHLIEKYKDSKNIIVFKSREEIDSYVESCKKCSP